MLKKENNLNSRGYKNIAGLDEAGRGPLAGPVVASCVILKKYDFSNRIYDSKALTRKARELAYDEIIKNSCYGVGIVEHSLIDKINILQASARAMELAVEDMGVEPDYLLVDGQLPLQIYCNKEYIPKGDQKSLSIASASIIAKVTRDRIMEDYDKIYPNYGFAKHKGYGTKFHCEALKEHGPCPIHRRSFSPVARLI
ncbi:MAG: ribonuclease HII [Candidatus Omnitrophica bacterium]|nr:ribonuclease HII [Candidatus Omnitrophota bacterium]